MPLPEDVKKAERNARKLLEGILFLKDSLEMIPYDLNDFDWNIQVGNQASTFQLNLQGLDCVRVLCAGYEATGDRRYLELAGQWVDSWKSYEMNSVLSQKNPYTWNDHSVAKRVENILYLLLLLEEDTDGYRALLREQAEWLRMDQNYTFRHNHGVIQDRALICAAAYLDEENRGEWIAHALDRLEGQIKFLYSEDMICTENSFSYHMFDTVLFESVAELLKELEIEDTAGLEGLTEKAVENAVYFIMPNGFEPQFGDSNRNITADECFLKNQHFLYAHSLGKLGQEPKEKSVIFPESGYYIGRGYWSSPGRAFEDSAWVLMKAGYNNLNHKHADELSFMYYAKGTEIFTDCGYYNYMYDEFPRSYLVSAKAHNSILADNVSYELDHGYGKTGFSDWVLGEKVDKVTAYNYIYNGVDWQRTLYFFGDALLLQDIVRAEKEHTYSQLFQCHENLEIVESSGSEVLLRAADREVFVRVKQLSEEQKLVIHSGGDYGYVSRNGGVLSPIHTLEFKQTGKGDSEFLTLVTVEDQKGEMEKFDSISLQKGRKVEIRETGGEVFSISLDDFTKYETDPFEINHILVEEKDGRSMVFTDITEYTADRGTPQYAWYILEQGSGKRIDTVWYSEDSCLEYQFDPGICYEIKEFVVQGENKTSSVIGMVKYNDRTERMEFIEPERTIASDAIQYSYK